MKGLVFLIGLLITTFLTIFIGNVLPKGNSENMVQTDYAKAICNQLVLGSNSPISTLPLSQTVYGFTLAYLTYFISTNNLASQNIPTFILFPILIVGDIFWSSSNGCSTNILLITALIIAGILGTLWAIIIEGTNMPGLAYFSGISNKEVCNRPTKSLYRCRAVNSKKSAV